MASINRARLSTHNGHRATAMKATAESDELLAACRSPGFFERDCDKPQEIDTHISWVFLTPDYVYKLKKPVRFEFLDFSTPAKRRQACEDEIRLNSRLAPDVYLGLAPVTRERLGRLAFDGRGAPVEWAIKMRRLPETRNLDHLLRHHQTTGGECQSVARALARFYSELPPIAMTPDEYRARIERHVRANLAELLRPENELPDEEIARVHSAQLQRLLASPALFDERVGARRIVEGHGDLRPEHVCVSDPPAIFDCLEFSRELRTVDTADELCFLEMECDRLGAADVGQCILDECCRAMGDRPPMALVNFYKSYRACVRAKVAALRGGQLAGGEKRKSADEARAYLDLADGYARQLDTAGPLVIVRGVSGSGKTTLARALASAIAGQHLATDRIRLELFGVGNGPHPDDAGRYQPAMRDKVYAEMLRRADEPLSQGLPVILDGTFLRDDWRAQAASVAKRYAAPTWIIRCACPDDVARTRIERRAASGGDASEARSELVGRQRSEEEAGASKGATIDVDTTRPIDEQLQTVWSAMGAAFNSPSP